LTYFAFDRSIDHDVVVVADVNTAATGAFAANSVAISVAAVSTATNGVANVNKGTNVVNDVNTVVYYVFALVSLLVVSLLLILLKRTIFYCS
jgi:hypothetical protein